MEGSTKPTEVFLPRNHVACRQCQTPHCCLMIQQTPAFRKKEDGSHSHGACSCPTLHVSSQWRYPHHLCASRKLANASELRSSPTDGEEATVLVMACKTNSSRKIMDTVAGVRCLRRITEKLWCLVMQYEQIDTIYHLIFLEQPFPLLPK